VSLSTLRQGQGPVMHRVLEALGQLPVRALVTLGPSLDRSDFTAPPNTVIEAFVPHDLVMPHAAAMVTQCGLGTLAKALAFGLPLVCIPIIADQPGNAALAVVRGAGVRLSPSAPSREVARAIMRVLCEPRFREAASRLASRLSGEDGALNAALQLEQMAP
jgi:UDP:flavonoid glycosyltransferase YjiC (YdhE family)